MANNENLKPNSERTPRERKELASKAGKASGKKRRELKTMKLMLDYLLSKKIENKQTGKKVTTLEGIMLAQIKQALSGNTKAAIFIRDTLGERPAEQITNTNINIEDEKVVNEVLNKLKDL